MIIVNPQASARLIRCFAFALLLLVVCGCDETVAPDDGGLVTFPRESKIPPDAEKVTPETDDHPPILHDDRYEDPVPMAGPINTAGGEDAPFITPDGSSFYFFFTPDVQIPAESQLIDGVTGIYWSRKNGGSWTEPERVVLNDEPSLDGCEFVQGSTMWFCSVRPGNLREIDFYTAQLRAGVWENWQHVGERLNLEIGIGEMHLSTDGSTLYFHAERSGGAGGLDIWLTRRSNGVWQDPEPVGAVNTAGDEGWPFLTEDGQQLWFTRTHEGTPGIFKSDRAADSWMEPELVLSQFAGEPTLDRSGNLYFTHHFYRDGVMIEADIYVAGRK